MKKSIKKQSNKSSVFDDNINKHRLINFENICLKGRAVRYELITSECKKGLVMWKSKIYTAQDQQLGDKFKIQYDVVHNCQPGNQSDYGTISLHKSLMKSQLIIVISEEEKVSWILPV